jgi:hypothetical protein
MEELTTESLVIPNLRSDAGASENDAHLQGEVVSKACNVHSNLPLQNSTRKLVLLCEPYARFALDELIPAPSQSRRAVVSTQDEGLRCPQGCPG